MPCLRAICMPIGAITNTPTGAPIAEMLAVRPKKAKGRRTTFEPIRASTASMTRSIVPFARAIPKKYVTPASITIVPTGNPSSTSASGMSASNTPTPHAAANMTMPIGTLRTAAMAKIATKTASAASGSSIPISPDDPQNRLRRRQRSVWIAAMVHQITRILDDPPLSRCRPLPCAPARKVGQESRRSP